jgi:hypothetical protein
MELKKGMNEGSHRRGLERLRKCIRTHERMKRRRNIWNER